jgi:hypothetical protein
LLVADEILKLGEKHPDDYWKNFFVEKTNRIEDINKSNPLRLLQKLHHPGFVFLHNISDLTQM